MADNRDLMILTCPDCGQRMKIPSNAMGKTYKCVKCGGHVKVQAGTVEATDTPVAESPGEKPVEPIGALLLGEGVITQAQLDQALDTQQRDGGKLIEILIRAEALTKDDLHAFLSKQSGVAGVDLSRVNVDRELLKLIPKEMALENLLLPIDRLGKLLTVGMACPLDLVTIAAMEQHTGLRVKAVLCRYDDIQAAVTKHYPSEGEGGMYVFTLPEHLRGEDKLDLTERIATWQLAGVSPEAAKKLEELCQNSASTPAALVKAAAGDAALAAAILKTANSLVFGVPGEVDSLPLALSLLGREGARVVAAKSNNGASPHRALLMPLREQARRTALAAASLARASVKIDAQLALCAGLVHQIGRWTLASVASEKYERVGPTLTGAPLAEAEHRYFVQDHLVAGASVASRWRFPNDLYQVIRHYAQPEKAESDQELVHLIALASWAAAGESEANAPRATAEQWARVLGVKWSAVEKAAAEARQT